MAQVPATSYESTSLGDVAEFTIPFPFLSRAEVFVTVDGASVPFTWINDGLVQLATVPELGAVVRRYRSTAAYVPLHQFSTGVPFLPRYVDRDFKQTLYAVQESVNDTANIAATALDTAEQALLAVQASFDLLGERTQYIVLGAYGPGLNFQTSSQVFSYLGEFYAPGPGLTLPYVTTGVGAPEIASFRSVGDAVLRQDLATPFGAELVGHAAGTVASALDSLLAATVTVGSIAELKLEASAVDGEHVAVTAYYSGWAAESPFIGPQGGGVFVWDSTSVAADNGVTILEATGVITGRWIRINSGAISLWDAGCVSTPGVDNRDRILAALYCGADTVLVPAYQFDSSPIQIGIAANGVTLRGEGFDSCLSLIGTQIAAAALVHIPKVGDAYNGLIAGAQNFTVDNLRLRGDQATGTVSTTGLVANDATNLQIGTLWSHGFYKSGVLFGGAPTRIHVGKLYSYNNGNHPTSSTGGQGFAIVSDTVDYPAIHVEFAECWDNGISNFGQGLDMVRGNFTAGTLLFHDNGGSGCKVVNLTKGKIDKLVVQRNNRHAGQTFGGLYTNGDFGELDIGVMEADTPAGSGLVIINTGTIRIGRYRASNCPSSGITTPLTTGKVATLEIGQADISACAGVSLLLGGSVGDMTVNIGSLLVRDGGGTSQGVNASCKHLHIGRLNGRNMGGAVLNINGTPDSAYVGQLLGHSATSIGSMAVIAAGVVNAVILSARKFGTYGTTLSDSGTTTYKPNVI